MELKSNYSFQHGMPLSIKEIIERSGSITFSELLDHAEQNTNVCRITDNDGMLIHLIPILGDSIPFVDLNLVMAKGWTIDIYKQCGEKFTALTDSYWACKCKENYVHHKVKTNCTKCSCQYTYTGRLGYVEELLNGALNWKFIVGE